MDDNAIRLMMEKMLENPDRIVDTCQSGSEYYFKYKTHTFSISAKGDEYSLYIYPNHTGESIDLMVQLDLGVSPDEVQMVAYDSNPSFLRPFVSLYKLVAGRHLGINHIIDDIMRD
jgi:hypothetical protein